jgi:hypothetical protein
MVVGRVTLGRDPLWSVPWPARAIALYRNCAKLGASSVARNGMRRQTPNRHGADADRGFILGVRTERGEVPGTLPWEALRTVLGPP